MEQTQNENKKKIHVPLLMLKLVLSLAIVLVGSSIISRGVDKLYTVAKNKIEMAIIDFKNEYGIVKYEVVDTKSTETIQTLVQHYSSKYGISPSMAWAVIDKESSMNPSRIRFEETWKKDYAKNFPKGSLNNIEYDLLFSSFGLMQVSYPIWHEFCNITDYSQLLTKEVNIECGIKILSKCLYDSRDVYPQSKRIRGCFRAYNGSGERAELYANDLMSKLANYMLDEEKIVTAYTEMDSEEDNA